MNNECLKRNVNQNAKANIVYYFIVSFIRDNSTKYYSVQAYYIFHPTADREVSFGIKLDFSSKNQFNACCNLLDCKCQVYFTRLCRHCCALKRIGLVLINFAAADPVLDPIIKVTRRICVARTNRISSAVALRPYANTIALADI